ncbi:transposase family protein, partial [Streptomyces sp. NPDC002285]
MIADSVTLRGPGTESDPEPHFKRRRPPSRQHRVLPGLPQRLATLTDPRHWRGKRHPFVSVLLTACGAVLSGARSFAAIGQWARAA